MAGNHIRLKTSVLLAEPINIGFIGVVTTEIPNLVLAEHHKDYTFTDPAEEIVKYSKELVDQDVNAIVVLGHTPSVQGSGETVSGETAEIMNKVKQTDPDNSVDAFFAGHNHVYTNGVVGNTRIVQSTSQGKAILTCGENTTQLLKILLRHQRQRSALLIRLKELRRMLL